MTTSTLRFSRFEVSIIVFRTPVTPQSAAGEVGQQFWGEETDKNDTLEILTPGT